MKVSRRKITNIVESIYEPIDHFGGLCPLRTLGRSGEITHIQRSRCDESGEGYVLSVGRYADAKRRRLQIGESRRLARIHPSHVDLWRTAAVGYISDALAVLRPPR